MRIFCGGIATETNTFAPMPTGLASFHEGAYHRAGEHPPEGMLFSGPLVAARQRRDEAGPGAGWVVVEGLVAAAQPSGPTTSQAWAHLRDTLLDDLRAALPVDVVLLGLHGAMVADGCDDCEGELLERVRGIVGPGVVVGAELDPHHHLSGRMVRHADLLVAFKEYPHTDWRERGLELVDLCVAQARGRIRPVAAVADTGMIAVIHTTREPARGFVDRLHALEGRDGILSISITHGFPWGDVADMGTRVMVYADGDETRASALARALADELWAMREQLGAPYPDIDAALDQALAHEGWPVVLADSADNPGGGAAGDSTFILRRLLERGVAPAVVGPLWDPVAVRIASEAGVGARLALRIGGKVSPMSGPPVDLEVTVRSLEADAVMTGLGGTRQPLGATAWVEHALPAGHGPDATVGVVLCSVRTQGFDTDLFTGRGIDLRRQRVVVVKSSQHFHASFSKVAARVIYVDAPGSVTQDLKSLPYRKVARPRWPL